MVGESDPFRVVVEHAPDGLLLLRDHSIVYANPIVTFWLGRPLPGLSVLELVHADDRPRIEEQLAAETDAWVAEVRLVGAGGAALPVEAAARRIDRDHGPAIIVVLRDATRRIEAMEESRKLREEFVSVFLRELRDPVQTILLHAHVLLTQMAGGEATGPAAPVLGIQKSALHISQIAGDIVDAILLEIGKLRLHRRLVNLPLSVAALTERLRHELAPHAVTLHVEGDPPSATVDPQRLDQILSSLLENAARYSAGDAPIQVTIAPQSSGTRISVADRGPGISDEELPRIFDRFYMGRQPHERKGLGLGLFITKCLVEAHGGRIGVESRMGVGITFHVWLPATPMQVDGPTPTPPRA